MLSRSLGRWWRVDTSRFKHLQSDPEQEEEAKHNAKRQPPISTDLLELTVLPANQVLNQLPDVLAQRLPGGMIRRQGIQQLQIRTDDGAQAADAGGKAWSAWYAASRDAGMRRSWSSCSTYPPSVST